MLEYLVNPKNLWPIIREVCQKANSFVTEKTGKDLNLELRCEQTKDFVMSHSGYVFLGVTLFIIILICIWALKKLNSRMKVFDATLLSVKEITHDTKIFTFDLPKGWSTLGLNIGEHLALSYLFLNKGLKSMAKWRNENTPLFRGLTSKEILLIYS